MEVVIEVRQEHIDRGRPKMPNSCPVFLAAAERLPPGLLKGICDGIGSDIQSDYGCPYLRFEFLGGSEYVYGDPVERVIRYDRTGQMEPFSFTLKIR